MTGVIIRRFVLILAEDKKVLVVSLNNLKSSSIGLDKSAKHGQPTVMGHRRSSSL